MYRDKHGNEIENWMFLQRTDGSMRLVVSNKWITNNEKPDLGFLNNCNKFCPLSQFDLSEWEIYEEE